MGQCHQPRQTQVTELSVTHENLVIVLFTMPKHVHTLALLHRRRIENE